MTKQQRARKRLAEIEILEEILKGGRLYVSAIDKYKYDVCCDLLAKLCLSAAYRGDQGTMFVITGKGLDYKNSISNL